MSVPRVKTHRKGVVVTCLGCRHRGWRLSIRSRCPLCGTRAIKITTGTAS